MIVELSVPGCPESVFLVPDEEAEALRAKARNPGRLWSFSEVSALKARGVTTEEAQRVAEMKMLLYASSLWVRPGKLERDADALAASQSGIAFE